MLTLIIILLSILITWIILTSIYRHMADVATRRPHEPIVSSAITSVGMAVISLYSQPIITWFMAPLALILAMQTIHLLLNVSIPAMRARAETLRTNLHALHRRAYPGSPSSSPSSSLSSLDSLDSQQ